MKTTSSTVRMAILTFGLALTLPVSACDGVSSGPQVTGQAKPAKPAAALPAVKTKSDHCELVNGTGKGCAIAERDPATDAAIALTAITAGIAIANGDAATAGMMGTNLGNLLGGGGGGATPQASTPSAGGLSGCEWKGRNFAPGDTIHYQRDGDIFMRDVKIDGKPFNTFVPAGQHLSSPNDKAQTCECQVSRKHWGCV